MLKNATNKEKFSLLEPWMPMVIADLKKDFRQDHLRKDPQFLKLHFGSKPVAKITNEELIRSYLPFLKEGNEDIWEFMSNRWLLKHAEIYHLFEKMLLEVSPEFTELELLEEKDAEKIIQASTAEFGAIDTLIFSVINSVVFPKASYEKLQKLAGEEQAKREMEKASEKQVASIEEVKQVYERELNRVTDRLEKRLIGMQSKYDRDVAALKKQIATLQRKLNGQTAVSV